MDELSEAARRLMDLATAEDAPPAEALDESWGMLAQRVQRESAAGIGASAVVEPAAPPGGLRWSWWAAVAVVVVGGGLWLATRPSAVTPSPAPAVTPAPAMPRPAPPAAQSAPDPSSRPDRRPTEPDGARLLDEAEAALADDPARALALLVRHADTDTDATLVPRRLALRVRCLCALGRHDDARHEATAFLERHGESTFAAQVRASCGGTPEADP